MSICKACQANNHIKCARQVALGKCDCEFCWGDVEKQIEEKSILKKMVSNTILTSSVVSSKDYSPFVQLTWGNESGQLTPGEARQHAYNILQAAEAAESDSMLILFLRERVGIKDNIDVGQILNDFRQFRRASERRN